MNENIKPIKIFMKVKSNILIVFYSFSLQIITQLYIYLSKINVFYLYPPSTNMNKLFSF